MPTNKPQLKTYVSATTYEKFKLLAKYENRSTSNLLELLAERAIAQYEAEHGEIKVDTSNE